MTTPEFEKRQLAQAMLERREVELDHREGLRARQEASLRCRACPSALPVVLQRSHRDAVAELHEVLFAVAPDASA